jgi:hypothetical protein
MELDWGAVIEKGGIATISVVALFIGYQVTKLFIGQWKASTDAMDRNTQGYEKLTEVFTKSAEMEEQFQKEVVGMLRQGHYIAEDTNRKVHEIHRKVGV